MSMPTVSAPAVLRRAQAPRGLRPARWSIPAAVTVAIMLIAVGIEAVGDPSTAQFGSRGTAVFAIGSAAVGALIMRQFLLSPFTSGRPIAVAVSTLAVVAIFQPLRRLIRSAVDRRFYRRRDDAERTLEAFSSRLRDEVDLVALQRELLGAVNETVQPAQAGVWLRSAP